MVRLVIWDAIVLIDDVLIDDVIVMVAFHLQVFLAQTILGRELGPSGVSPNQNSRWKLAFSPLKHV